VQTCALPILRPGDGAGADGVLAVADLQAVSLAPLSPLWGPDWVGGEGKRRTVTPSITEALTGFIPQLLPEVVLGLAACVLFLGATWRVRRHVWGLAALAALAIAGLFLA